jgi:hypothetical protein
MKKYFLSAMALLVLAVAFSSFRFQQNCPKAASIIPVRMNVFYIGVDNPLLVSAPGVPPGQLNVSVTGTATITGSNGNYNVRAVGGSETNVNVDYTDENGNLVKLSSSKFRIKRVPDPVCFLGTVKSIGLRSKAEFASQAAPLVRLENFDFDMRFEISSFILATYQDTAYMRLKTNGPAFTAEMKSLMNKAKPKDRYYIEEVIVKGPDGTLRKIPGVTIEIK